MTEENKQHVKHLTKLRVRAYRELLTEEKKQHVKHLAKLRMRAYRERKKQGSLPTMPTEMSPEERKTLRKKWTESKRKQRAKETVQKRELQKRKRLNKTLAGLSPENFVTVVSEAATPKKKAALLHHLIQDQFKAFRHLDSTDSKCLQQLEGL